MDHKEKSINQDKKKKRGRPKKVRKQKPKGKIPSPRTKNITYPDDELLENMKLVAMELNENHPPGSVTDDIWSSRTFKRLCLLLPINVLKEMYYITQRMDNLPIHLTPEPYEIELTENIKRELCPLIVWYYNWWVYKKDVVPVYGVREISMESTIKLTEDVDKHKEHKHLINGVFCIITKFWGHLYKGRQMAHSDSFALFELRYFMELYLKPAFY